jgi:hypothetical protein
MLKTEILNDKGSPIILNDREERVVNHNQQILNSLGYEVNLTSLTAISKRITEQKFFQIKPSEFMPIVVGEGTWSAELLTYRSYALGGDFETGIVNTGAENDRLARADAGVDSITVPITNWIKEIGWSIFDLQLASKAGNWDLVTAKETARKKNWDLGIQKVAFLGLKSNPNVDGLLTQSDVTVNTAVIPTAIRLMTSSQFNSLLAAIIGAYQTNCNYTAMPTHFIIPQNDYNGLASFPDSTYPLKTKLEILESAFKVMTRNPNFKILPVAYADQVNNASVSGLNTNIYTLLNYDAESVRMDIPLDYTNTMANTINGMQYQNAGYGQFTGVKAYRPLEMIYFTQSVG